jgi:MFS transporter, Spinster family, sphingosine-1-phosphate transporter
MNHGTATTSGLQRRVLALLLLAYIFNFLDRQILAILAIPITEELGLTKTQMGLMGGIAFASVYSTLAIPFARYADRRGRVKVISAAIAVWSGFTALCGTAASFWQLFLFRMGVGVGEAGGVAPSYALIADYFPPSKRARALAVFSLGIPIGSAIGLFFGGWIASALSWRWAFAIIGLAGLPLAFALWRFIPEPERGTLDPYHDVADQPRLGEVFAILARKPSFWLLSFGAASASICGYGLGFWFPTFFKESLGIPLARIGLIYGIVVLVGGMAGIWLGGAIGDRVGHSRPSAYALVPGVAFLLTAPLYIIALNQSSLLISLIFLSIAYALSLAWLGPVVNAVQNLVAPPLRATASACMLLINNLIGIGFGTTMFGWLADWLEPSYGSAALRYSMLFGLGFYLLAALLMFGAVATLKRDWFAGPAKLNPA